LSVVEKERCKAFLGGGKENGKKKRLAALFLESIN